MSKEIIIDYCVFLIWNDSLDYNKHIDEEQARKIIAFEYEAWENSKCMGYDLSEDLYYMLPAAFAEQWNWLVDNEPETYGDIPECNRRRK